MSADLRVAPAVDHILVAELTTPQREALAGLLAATARAVDAGVLLPSYLHAAVENALLVLGGPL